MPLPPDRDLNEWDAEIEAEYQRFKESWNASGRRKRAGRHVGVPWAYLADVCRLTEGRAALVVSDLHLPAHHRLQQPDRDVAVRGVGRTRDHPPPQIRGSGPIAAGRADPGGELDRADGTGDFDLARGAAATNGKAKLSRPMRRTILINVARMLWRLADRITHHANAMFIAAHHTGQDFFDGR